MTNERRAASPWWGAWCCSAPARATHALRHLRRTTAGRPAARRHSVAARRHHRRRRRQLGAATGRSQLHQRW